jgi:RNA polymerase sigma-70 factor, ECF subfamily
VIRLLERQGDDVDPTASEQEFDAFFRKVQPRLVAQAYVYTGVLAQAQDLAHETLARAWEQWSRIRDYENPGAWARKVLSNLATSESRRTKVRRQHQTSLTDVDGPDLEALALADALRTIPMPQRHAIVLHDAIGIPIHDVALELGVPEGTVRSWLSRGRRALAVELNMTDEKDVIRNG